MSLDWLRREARSWKIPVIVVFLVLLVVYGLAKLEPSWSQPGHKDMVILLAIVVVVVVRLEVRGVVNAVIDRLLPHITGTVLTERLTTERFDRVEKKIDELKEDYSQHKEKVEVEIYRIKGHLKSLPGNLRFPEE